MAGKSRGREQKYTRHWLILANLPDGIGGKRADQIAREAGCSVSTVYRDLDMLIGAGFPVEKEKTARGTVWRLARGFRSFPPVPLSPVDAAALTVAERRLRAAGDGYFADLLTDMLAKLRKGRGAELARVLARLEESFVGMGGETSEPATPPDPRPAWRETIVRAIETQKKIRVDYREEKGRLSRGKKLSPLRLWIVGARTFLLASTDGIEQVRTFDLERFRRVEATDEVFRQDWVLGTGTCVEEPKVSYRRRPEEVELEFDSQSERELLERPVHESQVLERRSSRLGCRLRVVVSEELVLDLMRFGGRARVVAPRRLAKLLADRHRAAASSLLQSAAEPSACEPLLPLSFD